MQPHFTTQAIRQLTVCVPCPRSFGLTRSWAHKVGLHKQAQQQRQREASAGIDPHNNRLSRSAMTPQPTTLVRSPSTLRFGFSCSPESLIVTKLLMIQ